MAEKKEIVLLLEMILEEEDDEISTDDAETALLIASVRENHYKIFDYVERTIPQYLPQQFKRFYRLDYSTFEKICGMLSDHPAFQIHGWGGRQSISIEKQILIFLWYMCTLDTIAQISDRFGVTDYSVIHSRDKAIEALLSKMPNIIKWPDHEEYAGIAQRFQRNNGFPTTIGAIDGTHIRIKAPKENHEDYLNRKKYHSIVLQAVCREDTRFTDIFVGFPGSVHDSRVLRNSDLYRSAQNDCEEMHIIGDGGYPLKYWLMVPFKDNGHLQQQEKVFNQTLSSSRQVIERSFGLMKGRLRRLQYLDVRSVETAVNVIAAACILHNIFVTNKDFLPDRFDEENPNERYAEDAAAVLGVNDNRAREKRIRIMNNL